MSAYVQSSLIDIMATDGTSVVVKMFHEIQNLKSYTICAGLRRKLYRSRFKMLNVHQYRCLLAPPMSSGHNIKIIISSTLFSF